MHDRYYRLLFKFLAPIRLSRIHMRMRFAFVIREVQVECSKTFRIKCLLYTLLHSDFFQFISFMKNNVVFIRRLKRSLVYFDHKIVAFGDILYYIIL